MKPLLKALFAFFVAVSQRPALAINPADTIPDGIFFRISGGGLAEPSYILGSLHTIPGDTILDVPARCPTRLAAGGADGRGVSGCVKRE